MLTDNANPDATCPSCGGHRTGEATVITRIRTDDPTDDRKFIGPIAWLTCSRCMVRWPHSVRDWPTDDADVAVSEAAITQYMPWLPNGPWIPAHYDE